jgi:hypothetical protein
VSNREYNLRLLKEEIEANGGILAVDMRRLRNDCGWDKLGPNVVNLVSNYLQDVGIGHLPEELPRYQDRVIRVYLKSSVVGQIIGAVRGPSDAGDRLLRRVGASDAELVLEQIRSLICGNE